jgi:hypothetical protein
MSPDFFFSINPSYCSLQIPFIKVALYILRIAYFRQVELLSHGDMKALPNGEFHGCKLGPEFTEESV